MTSVATTIRNCDDCTYDNDCIIQENSGGSIQYRNGCDDKEIGLLETHCSVCFCQMWYDPEIEDATPEPCGRCKDEVDSS